MITLSSSDTLHALAGTGSAISYVVDGVEISGAGLETYKVLANGTLGTGDTAIYSPTTTAMVKTIFLSNTTAGSVTFQFGLNGSAATIGFQIISASLPANGSATFNGDGWRIYSSTGYVLQSIPLSQAVPQSLQVAGFASTGTSAQASASDHKHAIDALNDTTHGIRGNGSLHSAVVAGVADGFMSNTDKTKLDGIATGAVALTGATPATEALGDSGVVGVASTASPADHKHPMTALSDTTHGSRGSNNTHHAVAVAAGNAGFLSGSDKTKLDSVASNAAALTSATPTTETLGDSASVGVATTAAKADHAHAMTALSDSTHGTRAGGTLHPQVTGSVDGFMIAADKTKLDTVAASAAALTAATPTTETLGDTAVVGVATTAARADHKHAMTALDDTTHGSRGSNNTHHAVVVAAGNNGFMSGTDKTKLDGIATGAAANTSSTPSTETLGDAAVVGVATTSARADHKHAMTALDDTTHGTRAGGTLHASATTSTAGFMSPLDKKKVDNIWIDVTANSTALVLTTNTAAQNITAINAILAAAPSGSTIFFPPGEYSFNAAWTWPSKFLYILGQGQNRSGGDSELKWTSNVGGNLITLTDGFWYSRFTNITFSTTVDQTVGYAVQCGNNVGINFQNCTFQTAGGFFNNCIGYDSGANSGNSCFVDKCEVGGFKGTGIRVSSGGTSVVISDTQVLGQWGPNSSTPASAMAAAGISGGWVGALQINDCDIIGCVNNLLLNPVSANGEVCASVFVTNTYFDNSGGSCIKITGTGGTVRCRFDTCSFTTAGTNFTTAGTNLTAVEIASTFAYAAGGQGIDFVNCNVLNTFATTGTTNGFLISGTADFSVGNCRIAGWTNGVQVTPIGTAGRTQCQINNNTIGPAAGFAGNTTGIVLNAGSAAYGSIVLDGNILVGNTTPLTDNSTTTGQNAKVYGQQPGLAPGQSSAPPGATVLTTVETVLAVLPLPANSVKIGTTFKFLLSGKSAATSIHNVRIRVGTSNNTPATNGSLMLFADATNANNFVVTGVSGVGVIGGSATHIGNAHMSNAAVTLCTANAAATGTFNSATDNFVMLTLTNGTSTTTTVYGATLEVINP